MTHDCNSFAQLPDFFRKFSWKTSIYGPSPKVQAQKGHNDADACLTAPLVLGVADGVSQIEVGPAFPAAFGEKDMFAIKDIDILWKKCWDCVLYIEMLDKLFGKHN